MEYASSHLLDELVAQTGAKHAAAYGAVNDSPQGRHPLVHLVLGRGAAVERAQISLLA